MPPHPFASFATAPKPTIRIPTFQPNSPTTKASPRKKTPQTRQEERAARFKTAGGNGQWASLDALVATSTTAPTSLAHLLQHPSAASSHALPVPSALPKPAAEARNPRQSGPRPSKKRESEVDTASARPLPPAPAAKRARKSTAKPAAGETSIGKKRGRTPRASKMVQKEKVMDKGSAGLQSSAAASEKPAPAARSSLPPADETEPSVADDPVPASGPVSQKAATRRPTAALGARRPPRAPPAADIDPPVHEDHPGALASKAAQTKQLTRRPDASRKPTVATSRQPAPSPPRPAAEPAPPALPEPDKQLAAFSATKAASKKPQARRKPAAPARSSPPAPPSTTREVDPPAREGAEASAISRAKPAARRSRKPAARPSPPLVPAQGVVDAAPLSSHPGQIDEAPLPVELPPAVPRPSARSAPRPVASTSSAPVPPKKTDQPPAVPVKTAVKRSRARKQVEQVDPVPQEKENSASAPPPDSKRARLSPPAPPAKKTNPAPPPLPPAADASSTSSSPASNSNSKSKTQQTRTRIRTERLEGNTGRLNVFDVLVGGSNLVLARLREQHVDDDDDVEAAAKAKLLERYAAQFRSSLLHRSNALSTLVAAESVLAATHVRNKKLGNELRDVQRRRDEVRARFEERDVDGRTKRG
ncbi:hypothetical protein JCM5296_001909 [Sporobolomyces johnsonii]